MPKKRKESEKVESKRNLIILLIIVVIAVIAIILVLNYQKAQGESQKNSENQQNSENKLVLSSDSLKFYSSFYLNDGYDRTYCAKELNCEINDLTIVCPKVDRLTLQFHTYNIENFAFISCRIDDEGELYQESLDFYPSGKIVELSFQNIAYNKAHNFDICCQYDDGSIQSNEFCLPTIKVKSLCA